jgi:streptogramin lyase
MTAAVVIAKLPGQSVFDALKNATLAGQASANFTIEVGIDPFSVEFDKTFTLYFRLNKNQSPPLKLDYDL